MAKTARADTVGSLLRPAEVVQARNDQLAGKISAADRRAVDDRAVLDAIALQTSVGLDVISDGEMRRASWNAAIGVNSEAPFAGYEMVDATHPIWRSFWRGADRQRQDRPAAAATMVTSKLSVARDIVSEEYGFLKANTTARTKYTFPAPSYHRAFWDKEVSSGAYATVDDYLRAVCELTRREIVDKLVAMGCDYIQLDAPNYGQIYTDPEVRAAYERQGHDLEAEVIADAEIDNALFEGLPSSVTRAIHICRGNGPGGIWSATGGYERFAEAMFPRLSNFDTLLLEYDSDRAGGFEPLQHVRDDTTVVLGLLTTKTGDMESASDVEGPIREASSYVPLERLSLSPQCGFSSAPGGNPITVEQQRAKLALVSDIAHRVWS
jgi:5-methyltetrahydropteroyltriglutamate--homocysteine methyltransferase